MKKISILLSVCFPGVLFCQESDSLYIEYLETAVIQKVLKKDSEYANKMPLKAIENPQVYSTIDKSTFENQIIFTVDDALRNVPGVQRMWSATNRSGDGGTYVNMRGFIAENSLRNGLYAPVSMAMDAVNIEKVEVLKGPSATMFGSNTSYGGLINRVTKKPHETLGGQITLSGGSFNYYRAQADVNVPLMENKKLLFRLNTAYSNSGTFRDTDAKNSFYAFVPSLTYKPSENLEFNVEYEAYETNSNAEPIFFFYFGPDVLGIDNANQMEDLGWDYKESYYGKGLKTIGRSRNLFGEIKYQINENIRSTTNINTSYSSSNGYNPYFYLAPKYMVTGDMNDTEIGIVRADQSTQDSKRNILQIQQNFNFDFNWGEMRNRTVAGFDYVRLKDDQFFKFTNFDWVPFSQGDFSNFNAENLAAIYALLEQDSESYAANNTYPLIGVTDSYSGYISNVFTPIRGLNLLTAIRYESKVAKDGQVGQSVTKSYSQDYWSPKFGLVYEILPDKLSVFGNYQNSFKSNGYFISDGNGTISLAEPEIGNQLEGGLKASLVNKRLNMSLSYYNIKVEQTLMNTGEFTTTGLSVQNQAGELESKGVEFELSAYLIKGFSLLAGVSYNEMNYTVADNDVVNRRPLTASSPWLVNFDASYQFLDGTLKGLGFGVGGNYASDNKIVNSVSMGTFILPEYFVMNAHAFYDASKYRISFKVDNLTNEKYWNGYTTANAQLPLNVAGSLAFKF
jgi:iron complex outermembrane receptor protein